jgi:LuxR family maltose regulon positive regulatory protein
MTRCGNPVSAGHNSLSLARGYGILGPMETPLLQTKLYIPPPRPELVSRPRLIERLNKGRHRKLTLISAPAGFGKTTLVSSWIDHLAGVPRSRAGPELVEGEAEEKHTSPASPHPHTAAPVAPGPLAQARTGWLSLDEGDNDLSRFLAYFVSALQTVEANIGQGALSALQSPQPPPTEAVLTSLLNEITPFPDRIILVLDDYHLIETQPIHDALTFLLEHLPVNMHLVVATREDPHLPWARLRAHGQLTELRATDLRFTSSEAAEFLNQVMDLDLSAEDIATLETRTEGWIAGLQLAAISMQGSKDATGFIKSFTGSHRYVLDYLIEEVLEQQSESVRAFLLQTAVLDRLTGSLCNALTGQSNGQATLERLEHANLFIVSLDQERCWYRYHHLFSDLLRQRLRQEQPDWVPTLHHRASEWYEQNGFADEAIEHALRGEDFERAAHLLEEHVDALLQRGEHTTVSGWINALPDSLVREHPYLCVFHAWALQLTGQFEATEARLLDAEEALANLYQENDADADTIRGYIHSHRAYLTFIRGEHAKTINYARQALEQLPPEATVIRTQTALYLGVAYRFQGEFQAALDIFTEAVAISQKMGGSVTAVLSFLNLAELYTEQAHLHQARNIYEQALQFTKHQTGRPDMPFSGYAYVGIGRVLRQWNELDNAYRHITKGIALCRERNVAELLALSCIELAHIQHALGNDEQAREALQEAKQIFDGFSPWGSDMLAAHQAHLDLMQGEVESAERWAQASDLNIDDELELHREVEYLALAQVFIAQNRFEQALSLLGRLQQIVQAIGKMQSVLETLILQAMALSAQGDTEQALIKLEQALAIGEPENYVRIFVDEGPPMARLLYEAVTRGIAPDYTRRLLAAFPVAEPEQTDPPKAQALKSELVEPLSERELEVLQLIAAGLTNQEIATQLVLTLNTVKVHTRNIYGKLDAHNRTQAVARARALGILPSI